MYYVQCSRAIDSLSIYTSNLFYDFPDDYCIFDVQTKKRQKINKEFKKRELYYVSELIKQCCRCN